MLKIFGLGRSRAEATPASVPAVREEIDAPAAEPLTVWVASREEAAEGIVCLTLAPLEGQALPAFEAGAHVNVTVGEGLQRAYSLCGDPFANGTYRLGVLLEQNSRGGSAAVHRAFHVGKQVQITRPRNNFKLNEQAHRSILIAGGIGVTPMLSMAYRLKALRAEFELHYLCRSRSRAAFLEEAVAEFAQLQTYFDDEPQAPRFDALRVLACSSDGVHVYVCGPSGFMDHVLTSAANLEWKPENIHIERFSAVVDSSGSVFTVHAARSELSIDIPANKTIAEALKDHGIDVPLSCEQGICGTCLTRVIAGLPEHRDAFQTDEEKAGNTHITLCCSRARSSSLTLDI
jgi:vanillate O-demethylase ferredoxin subunit